MTSLTILLAFVTLSMSYFRLKNPEATQRQEKIYAPIILPILLSLGLFVLYLGIFQWESRALDWRVDSIILLVCLIGCVLSTHRFVNGYEKVKAVDEGILLIILSAVIVFGWLVSIIFSTVLFL